MSYTTIITEGGLLPAEILDTVATGEAAGQRAEDFGLDKGVRLSDEIAAAWGDARSYWDSFQRRLNRLRASDSPTTLTREQWVVPLLEVLGYRLSYQASAAVVEGRTYAISHREGGPEGVPVHIEGSDKKLDERPPSGRPRLSPHGLVQEYLNSTEQVWGIVTNGERLRLLRDSSRFTRPAYVEFDLRTMLEGEKFSEWALLYRLLHRSRLPQIDADATSCLLEKYHQQAVEVGGRVREGLRDGVEAALKRLGSGLLRHPANDRLRQKLAAGELSALDYYRQLLRLVYRLLFLMVAEERNLIAAEVDERDPLSPLAFRPSADARLAIYRDYYSVGRLRRMAEQSGVGRGPYDDLWQSLLTTFELLEGSDEQRPRALGLAPLDGDLFGYAACADLTSDTQLRNADLLATVRALSLYREKESKALRRVNYAALDVEELGSVYESLLDYRPVVQGDQFDLVTGTERKTTGSYYTRPELVQELIKSALEPVIEERLKAAGSDPTAQEQALLALTVCDPACGSGHFLLAAARRIGRALAKVRSGEDQPTPTQFRRAVRDVIGRCIFGVDLNPLAVDLCKLALWIEGHSAGLPLSFLDHHIKHGNSLVGATRKLVEAGIPDDAYKPVTGDDKQVASETRKRNKRERELAAKGLEQHTLFDAPAADTSPALAAALRRLDAQSDDSVASVRARAAAYKKLREDYSAERTLFDLWTAAFFQPLTAENARHVPTTKDLLDHQRSPKDLGDPKVALAFTVAQEVGFFHWELEFPQVFEGKRQKAKGKTGDEAARAPFGDGGFDVVLGNPPWERIKLQEQEHWVDVPEVANALNKAAREKVIAAWRASADPIKHARVAKFDFAKYQAEAESLFVRASARFPLTAVGDVNTYALFAEHFRNLIAPTGRAGIIVPTGIATDDTTKRFFSDLVNKQVLIKLLGFINEEGLFPGVLHNFKFCIMVIGGINHKVEQADFAFLCFNFEQAAQSKRHFTMSRDDFAVINPNTRTCPIFRTAADAELTKKIYRRLPVLVNENHKDTKHTKSESGSNLGVLGDFVVNSSGNPWGVRFMTMFHMSNDSGQFHNQPGEGLLPLYEGKLVYLYDHRFSSYESLAVSERMHMLPETSTEKHQNPHYEIRPCYYVKEDNVIARLSKERRKWLIGFRDATSSGLARTLIAAVLPLSAVGHKVPLIFTDTSCHQKLCFVSLLNSLVLDYIARQKIGGVSMAYFIVEQLPVLPPDRFSAADIEYIVPRVLELVYTAWDIRAFAEDVWAEADEGLRALICERWDASGSAAHYEAHPEWRTPPNGDNSQHPTPALLPFIWNDERRAYIRAELDARIARLYGLTRDELRYILDPHDVYGPDFPGETFRVLKEKEQKLYGEYRTRRLVLEAWDRECE